MIFKGVGWTTMGARRNFVGGGQKKAPHIKKVAKMSPHAENGPHPPVSPKGEKRSKRPLYEETVAKIPPHAEKGPHLKKKHSKKAPISWPYREKVAKRPKYSEKKLGDFSGRGTATYSCPPPPPAGVHMYNFTCHRGVARI